MACSFFSVQQVRESSKYTLQPTTTTEEAKDKKTTTIMANNLIFNNINTSTTINNNNNIIPSDQIGNINNNSSPVAPQSQELIHHGVSNPGIISSQMVLDYPRNRSSEKIITTTATNGNNCSSGISRNSSNSMSKNCKRSSCSTSSLLATVTKAVTSSDEEQEALLAEIDSDLPNFLSRTFMGQDARFSFILFFTVFSFSLVLGLFVIQASYAWHNYQLLEMLGCEDFSEEFFYLHYYDPPEPLTDESPSPGLRVNTSFYVH